MVERRVKAEVHVIQIIYYYHSHLLFDLNAAYSLAVFSVNLKAVVDEWLSSYKQSREVGLLVLINFIVRSCGCKGERSRGGGGGGVKVEQIIFPIHLGLLLISQYANDAVSRCCVNPLSVDNTTYQYPVRVE